MDPALHASVAEIQFMLCLLKIATIRRPCLVCRIVSGKNLPLPCPISLEWGDIAAGGKYLDSFGLQKAEAKHDQGHR